MLKWILNRVADILLALVVMTVVLWFVLTQPLFAFTRGAPPDLGLDRYALELSLRDLLAIPSSTDDPQARFDVTSEYLYGQLAVLGAAEQLDRLEGQRVLRLRTGNKSSQKLAIVLHYVVTEKPILEVAETTISLLELAKAISKQEAVAAQLNLTIFLHHPEQLAQSLNAVSAFHADQLGQVTDLDNPQPLLMFMPGLRVPEAAYNSGQWRYFSLLTPPLDNNFSFFGRLDDVGLTRRLKRGLRQSGLGDVRSLSIPVNFPGQAASPLKFYWDKQLSAMLVRPGILLNDENYEGHVALISALFGLSKRGY